MSGSRARAVLVERPSAMPTCGLTVLAPRRITLAHSLLRAAAVESHPSPTFGALLLLLVAFSCFATYFGRAARDEDGPFCDATTHSRTWT